MTWLCIRVLMYDSVTGFFDAFCPGLSDADAAAQRRVWRRRNTPFTPMSPLLTRE